VLCYEATFGQHERALGKGERCVYPLVAQDRGGAAVAFNYTKAYFEQSALLGRLVDEVLTSELRLTTGSRIQIFPCTQRSLRAVSIPCGILDELAFYRLEGSADADVEIQVSVRRGQLGFPHPRLIKISTPYMKGGVLYADFQRAFGVDDPDLLVWRAPTTLMNPTITFARLERERRLDPQRFAREYEAEFAEDISAFLSGAWVDAAVSPGVFERAPQPGLAYVGGCDPTGGGLDAFTLAVVHGEGQGARRVVQDVCRGWSKPRGAQANLEGAVQEIAAVLRRYGLSRVHGDRYGRGWVREAFARSGITYTDATLVRDGATVYLDRSSAYLECEPLFATGAITLIDHPQLLRELRNLERRPSPGGRDRVDHPRGQHDDYANALALAAVMARGAADATASLNWAAAQDDASDDEDDLGGWTGWGPRTVIPRAGASLVWHANARGRAECPHCRN
jgi:hypothetical protein